MKIKKSTLKKVSVILSIGVILLITVLLMNNSSEPTKDILFETVSASEFNSSLDEDSVILDIRTPEEYALGRIEGSKNIDFYSPDFSSKLDELDKDAEYKIYCNSGNRSKSAMGIMKSLGFTNVVELDGGIQDWAAFGLDTCINC